MSHRAHVCSFLLALAGLTLSAFSSDAVATPPVIQGNPVRTVFDAAGNVYVCGSFSGTVDFNPGAGESSRTSGGGFDAFVTRFNFDGSYAWTQTFGGVGNDFAFGMVFSESLNAVLVTGSFAGQSTGFGGSGTISNLGSTRLFVFSLEASNGAPRTTFNSTGVIAYTVDTVSSGYDVAIDSASGNAYVAGIVQIGATDDFDTLVLAFNATTAANLNTFGGGGILKLDVGGLTEDYAQGVTVSGGFVYLTGNSEFGFPQGYVVKLNATTGVVQTTFGDNGIRDFNLAGSSAGRAVVSGGTIYVTAAVPNPAQLDAAVLAMNTSDGELVTAFNGGGVTFGATFNDAAFDIAVFSNTVYFVGEFQSSSANFDAFVAAVNTSNGAALSTFNAGTGSQSFGGTGTDRAYGLAVRTGALYVCGQFNSTDAGLGAPGTVNATGFGGFLLKLDPATGAQLVQQQLPAITVTASSPNASEVGPVVGRFTVTLSAPSLNSLVVGYSVAGTATSGADFTNLANNISIPAQATTATITVTPVNDGQIEASETVIVTLNPGTGYTVGNPQNATVNIADAGGGGGSIPVITSSLDEHLEVSKPYSYITQATNSPTSYSLTMEPPDVPPIFGLDFNTANGNLFGTPQAFGEFFARISATNASGTGSAVVRFYILAKAFGELDSPFFVLIYDPYTALGLGSIDLVSALPPGLLFRKLDADYALAQTGSITAVAIYGKATQLGDSQVTLTLTRNGTVINLPLQITIGPKSPPSGLISDILISRNPVRTGSDVTFTAVSTTQNLTGTAFIFMKDGLVLPDGIQRPASSTDHSVVRKFATAGQYTVLAAVYDGFSIGTASVDFECDALAPQSAVENVINNRFENPGNGVGIKIAGSLGGVLDLDIDQTGGAGSPGPRANNVVNRVLLNGVEAGADSIDGVQAGKQRASTAFRFKRSDIFVAETEVNGNKSRRMLPISAAEIGQPNSLGTPDQILGRRSVTGRFGFFPTKPDTLTLKSDVELPGGIDITEPREIKVGIGNIVGSAQIDGKGRTISVSGGITKFKIMYPKKAGARAKFQITISGTELDKKGMDTDGIQRDAAFTALDLQVALIIEGKTYFSQVRSQVKRAKNGLLSLKATQ